MAGEFSTAGAIIGLDAVTGRVTQSARSTYLALLTSAPTDATTEATMAEVFTPASNGYNRQAVTWTAPTGDPASTENTSLLTFGPLTPGDAASVGWVALVENLTGTAGDVLMWWTVDAAKNAAVGDSITVAAGALVMTLD